MTVKKMKWLVVAGALKHMIPADTEALKAYLSRTLHPKTAETRETR